MTKPLETQVRGALRSITEQGKAALVRGVLQAAAYTAGEIASHLGAGNLARSFRAQPGIDEGNEITAWAASTGSAEKYAGIQDRGGTIYPRTRKALAVPIGTAGIAKGKWPRHFARGELKLVPRPGRAPLLVQEIGKRKVIARRDNGRLYKTWVHAIKPMFVLLPSVTIRPKNYLSIVSAQVASTVGEMIADAWVGKGD